jgi:hypothetical protein
LDSTFIRSREEGERHLEVRVGNIETIAGARQVFVAVAKAHTDIAGLIRRRREIMGQTEETGVTAFTGGACVVERRGPVEDHGALQGGDCGAAGNSRPGHPPA